MATNKADPELQASPYPCGNLLDGRRNDYLDIAIPLYRASIKGDWEAAKLILDKDGMLVRYSITEKKDTPLHVAAAGHSLKFVKNLLAIMQPVDLELQNADGNTAFCVAAISGNVDMVKSMLTRNSALPTICGSDNKLPLYLAALHGQREVADFLYSKSDKMTDECWTNDNVDDVLLKCIQSDIFDVALRMLKDNEGLPRYQHLWDVLHVLARKHKAFSVKRLPDIMQIMQIIASGKHPSMNTQHLN
ncbi:E3 ubiquitin-protein ligase XBAT32-like [Bidens hawaiensis]|uniref:E3 ubiquitin-protein ligase XBAT32-like n=1 Tax=Bidens hawaiensis TaxID=980011 RepID=UPI004049AB97